MNFNKIEKFNKIIYFIFNKWHIIVEDILEDFVQDIIEDIEEDITKIKKLLKKYKWWYVLYQFIKYLKIKTK